MLSECMMDMGLYFNIVEYTLRSKKHVVKKKDLHYNISYFSLREKA